MPRSGYPLCTACNQGISPSKENLVGYDPVPGGGCVEMQASFFFHLLLQFFNRHIVHNTMPVVYPLRQVHMRNILLNDLDLIAGGYYQ